MAKERKWDKEWDKEFETENWRCKIIPDKDGMKKIVCQHRLGLQETMELELPWWGISVDKKPYFKQYIGPLGRVVKVPADLDIEISKPKKVRERVARKEDYLDPKVGERMQGKRLLDVKADSLAVGVETGGKVP